MCGSPSESPSDSRSSDCQQTMGFGGFVLEAGIYIMCKYTQTVDIVAHGLVPYAPCPRPRPLRPLLCLGHHASLQDRLPGRACLSKLDRPGGCGGADAPRHTAIGLPSRGSVHQQLGRRLLGALVVVRWSTTTIMSRSTSRRRRRRMRRRSRSCHE